MNGLPAENKSANPLARGEKQFMSHNLLLYVRRFLAHSKLILVAFIVRIVFCA